MREPVPVVRVLGPRDRPGRPTKPTSPAEQDPAEYVQHRGIKETEAESVAYVVAGILGLDTSAYSIGYVAGWSQCEAETIKATAARVLAAAHTLADALAHTPDPEAQLATAAPAGREPGVGASSANTLHRGSGPQAPSCTSATPARRPASCSHRPRAAGGCTSVFLVWTPGIPSSPARGLGKPGSGYAYDRWGQVSPGCVRCAH